MSSHPTYRPDIDGLRAIAVLLVVIHHAFPQSLKGGFIGVDLFFVISGYLISTIIFQNLQQGTFSFVDFYKRRVKRIFPALCLVLIASFVYGWFTLLPADYKQLGKHMAAGAAFVSNFAFWNESGYFDGGSKLKPLLHLWSLGVEEQYYIFWPLIVLLVWKRKLNLLAVCVVLFVLSFAINMWTVKGNAVAAFYSPLSRFWELLIGSVLAYTSLHAALQPTKTVKSATSNNVTAWIGALLLAIGVYFINPERRFPGFWALFPTIAAYLLIKAGPQAWFNRVVLSNRLLVWMGLISFPLYLWHWPLLVFAELHEGKTPSVEIRLLMVAAAISLAWLTYRFVEWPIRFGKLVVETKKIPLALCAVLFVIAAVGGYTYKNGGFESRFPKFIQEILNNQPWLHEGWRLKTCILEQDHPSSEFADSCVDKNKRPLVFLWGDSHAAALYPGLKHLQDSGTYTFGIAQRTGAVCPPLLNDARPWCNEINTSSFNLIKELKPEIVMLYAYWADGLDGKGGLAGLYDLKQLDVTVSELKKAGVQKIILMGPTPYWNNTLPHNIVENWKKGNPLSKPPLRLGYDTIGLNEKLPLYNQQMKDMAKRLDISYIAGLDYFCNPDGCLTRDSEDGLKVTSIDYGHLTVDAAQTYIKQIAPLIFSKP
jgi:peptidoglycan/LPS O-acetylase OafA/YrhL